MNSDKTLPRRTNCTKAQRTLKLRRALTPTCLFLTIAASESMQTSIDSSLSETKRRLRTPQIDQVNNSTFHSFNSHNFPSVYSIHVDRADLLTNPFHKERIAEMDLLHVDCPTEESTRCCIQAMFHSSNELDYFQRHFSSSFSPLLYDADATEAIVLGPQRRRREEQDQNQQDRDALELFYSTKELTEIFSVGYGRISGFQCYLDYAGAMEYLQALVDGQSNYSHLKLELIDIGDSYLKTQSDSEGHDIYALKLSSATSTLSTKVPMMIVTGIHPREYAPPEMVRHWIHSFLDPDNLELEVILESTDIYWIPYVNPDGRVLAETTQMYRRKNLNAQADGSASCREDQFGVDLNRNFPFRWGRDDGSTDRPCLQTFRGSAAGSEPETQAVVELGKSIFAESQRVVPTNFNSDVAIGYNESSTSGIFLDIHSWGNYYIYPWGFENLATPNHDGLDAMTRKFSHFTGYSVEGPGVSYAGAASGATDDWAYSTLGAAGMTWELGTNFHQDCDTFEQEILEPNLAALTYAAKLARLPYRMSKGPDVVDISLNTEVLVPEQALTVSFQASDSVFSNIVYSLAAQDVQSVLIFVDQHPYGATDVSDVLPADWTLDGNQLDQNGMGEFTWNWETLEALWQSRSQPIAGRHVFYFIAIDTDGFQGPLSAIAVTVTVQDVPTGSPSIFSSDIPIFVRTSEPTMETTTPSLNSRIADSQGEGTIAPSKERGSDPEVSSDAGASSSSAASESLGVSVVVSLLALFSAWSITMLTL